MSKIAATLFLICIILPFSLARGEVPTSYDCRFTTGTLEIDGVLQEQCWKNADAISLYIPVTFTEPISKTVGRVCWDLNNIYIAFEATDRDLMAVHDTRDSQTFKDDVLEIFLQVGLDSDIYYNVEINAKGAFLDERRPEPTPPQSFDFQKIERAIVLNGTLNNPSDEDIGWIMEVAIPWNEINDAKNPDPTKVPGYKFHLARYDYSVYLPNGKELTSSAPLTKRAFHHRPDWVTLNLLKP